MWRNGAEEGLPLWFRSNFIKMYGTLFSLLHGTKSRAFSPLSERALYMDNTQCMRQTQASSDVAFPPLTSSPHPTSSLRPDRRVPAKGQLQVWALRFPGQVPRSQQDSGSGGCRGLVCGGPSRAPAVRSGKARQSSGRWIAGADRRGRPVLQAP